VKPNCKKNLTASPMGLGVAELPRITRSSY
jgi:hypothetical protein